MLAVSNGYHTLTFSNDNLMEQEMQEQGCVSKDMMGGIFLGHDQLPSSQPSFVSPRQSLKGSAPNIPMLQGSK